MENYQYQNPAAFQSAPAPAGSPAGGELFEGATMSAEELGNYGTNLIPPGEYSFTVVAVEHKRFQPGPGSKIGACNEHDVVFRIHMPDGTGVDIKNRFFMWTSTAGMIAEYYDAIGIHRKGDPIVYTWDNNVHIGKTGRCVINNPVSKNNNKYNNIQRFIPLGQQSASAAAVPQFGAQQPAYTAQSAPAQPAQPAQPAASPWATAKW